MMKSARSLRGAAAGLVTGLFLLGNASAQEACGLCAKEIVTNSELANCFLDQYEEFANSSGEAVAVDLSDCKTRGIVEPLPAPGAEPVEPDVQFIISRAQLGCLKKKLEEPGLMLDPSAKIELDGCG